MSDSGFVDEVPSGHERASATRPAPGGSGIPVGAVEQAPTARGRRRPGAATIGFVVLVVGLVAFGGWAWRARVHADDVAAYDSLAREIEVLDRSLPPLAHGEIPPCRDTDSGWITRTYPPSTGPQAAELVGYLEQKGWKQGAAVPPAVAHLTRDVDGHVLTIDVEAGALNQLVALLKGQSPGSGLGCLGR